MKRKLSDWSGLVYYYPKVLYEFLAFGFMGLVIETVHVYFMTGHWTIRGSLGYGLPIIHIYGIGTLVVIYLLGRLKDRPILFFAVSSFMMSMVELIGSYMEDLFGHGRSWDYSTKPFNFDGRICLSTALGWGTLSILTMYILYPEVSKLIRKIPRVFLVYSTIFLTFFVVLVTIRKYVLGF